MQLKEIKEAVDAGKIVHWANGGYQVIKDSLGQYLIAWDKGEPCECYWGLTHSDGVTVNGIPEQFYVEDESTNEDPEN